MDDTISKVPILVETLASKYNLSPSYFHLKFHCVRIEYYQFDFKCEQGIVFCCKLKGM